MLFSILSKQIYTNKIKNPILILFIWLYILTIAIHFSNRNHGKYLERSILLNYISFKDYIWSRSHYFIYVFFQ